MHAFKPAVNWMRNEKRHHSKSFSYYNNRNFYIFMRDAQFEPMQPVARLYVHPVPLP